MTVLGRTITEVVHAELIRRTDGLPAHINESWHKYLTLQGVPLGQLGERKLAYALTLGANVVDATGAAYWLNLLLYTTSDAELLLADGTALADGSQQADGLLN